MPTRARAHTHTYTHTHTHTHTYTHTPVGHSTICYPHLLSIDHPLNNNSYLQLHTPIITNIIAFLDSICSNISNIRSCTRLCHTVSLKQTIFGCTVKIVESTDHFTTTVVKLLSRVTTLLTHLHNEVVLQSAYQDTSSFAHGSLQQSQGMPERN